MPVKRYCEVCKDDIVPGALVFRFELHVRTVKEEGQSEKLATISGEYDVKCVQNGEAHDSLLKAFSTWFAAQADKTNGRVVQAPAGET